jgi:hypothetical protein
MDTLLKLKKRFEMLLRSHRDGYLVEVEKDDFIEVDKVINIKEVNIES